MSESSDKTRPVSATTLHTSEEADSAPPLQIGRYLIETLLGAGGFGNVYLARDPQLLRQVAIKVPRKRRISKPDFCNAFLAEARVLASLDHPHIVPVYDVGSDPDFPCFIVSKFIDGMSLSHRMEQLDWNWNKRAGLIATIADALHCAHLAGLVHRDVKPGNILLDAAEDAYLADFGLALCDDDYGHSWGERPVGTWQYMSPEQVRGESHLLDGRADVFSLGVVLYELLTGIRPFSASSVDGIINNILNREVTPLRQRASNVPKELERICLRALARRVTQRYSTALEFAEELRAFCRGTTEPRNPSTVVTYAQTHHAVATVRADSDTPPATLPVIIPKGLQYYDRHDAEFFLDILPGPRDRLGVPHSVRFWKHLIENHSPDESMRVGLLYGPSGCGKSSLIRAGLLPLLETNVVPVVVSATAQDTELRLAQALEVACAELRAPSSDQSLIAMLRRIRNTAVRLNNRQNHRAAVQDEESKERVVLLVIDQFEQWLSEHGDKSNTLLIQALRQCDGVRLKCLLLVRNDFWMSISHVMEELDAPILQGRNSAAVELFDLRHAQHVLAAFGRAYKALPPQPQPLTKSQEEFLRRSVEQLAEEGKIICVRLVVFAQMLRDKPWEPQTLASLGGVDGLGARFLEATFFGVEATPECRRFQAAAKKVLYSLLPPPGSNVGSTLIDENRLAEIAELKSDQRQFKALIRLLTEELCFLTKTDMLGEKLRHDSDSAEPVRQTRYYQLAHDFLVPALRTWLRTKQQETIAGRAQLCLEERTALWELSREDRQLPGYLETARILRFTPKSQWTTPQSLMMAQAKRRLVLHSVVFSSFCLLLFLAGWLGYRALDQSIRQRDTAALLSQLSTAELSETLPIVQRLDSYAPEAQSQLRNGLQKTADRSLQFRYLLALTPTSTADMQQLLQACGTATPDALEVAASRLKTAGLLPHETVSETLQRASTPRTQLRYATLLAMLSTSRHAELESTAPAIAQALLVEPSIDGERFAQLLVPIGDLLTPTLVSAFRDTTLNEALRTSAAQLLTRFANEELLRDLLLDATPSQHYVLITNTAGKHPKVQQLLQQQLTNMRQLAWDKKTTRQAAAGIAALLNFDPTSSCLNDYLRRQSDPSVRTEVMVNCWRYGVSLANLQQAVRHARDPVVRQALILASEPYHNAHQSAELIPQSIEQLCEIWRSSQHQCERSAAQWVLQRWQIDLPQVTVDQRALPARGERDWWVTDQGTTFVVLQQPYDSEGIQALMPLGRLVEDSPANNTRLFAISTSEVSRAEMLNFDSQFQFLTHANEDQRCPANRIDIVTAMKYCRWYSQQQAIPEDQMCYPPVDEITTQHIQLSDEMLARTGYRLPTVAEFRVAIAAGAKTKWSHGTDVEQLSYFGWSAANSLGRLYPCASLMPNSYGIFDMHGSIGEWCHPHPAAEGEYVLQGGNYNFAPTLLASEHLYYARAEPYSFTGFRMARTMPLPTP